MVVSESTLVQAIEAYEAAWAEAFKDEHDEAIAMASPAGIRLREVERRLVVAIVPRGKEDWRRGAACRHGERIYRRVWKDGEFRIQTRLWEDLPFAVDIDAERAAKESE